MSTTVTIVYSSSQGKLFVYVSLSSPFLFFILESSASLLLSIANLEAKKGHAITVPFSLLDEADDVSISLSVDEICFPFLEIEATSQSPSSEFDYSPQSAYLLS